MSFTSVSLQYWSRIHRHGDRDILVIRRFLRRTSGCDEDSKEDWAVVLDSWYRWRHNSREFPAGSTGITNSPGMWLKGPRGLVFSARLGWRWSLRPNFYLRQMGRIWSTSVITAARGDDSFYTAARGDDSLYTAARGVVSWALIFTVVAWWWQRLVYWYDWYTGILVT